MKRFFKTTGAVISATALAMLASSAMAADTTSTLDKILSEKKVRIGIILSIPPVGFKDNNGQPDGYDVDVAKMVAEKLGAKLEIVDTTAADRIPNLRTGKVDMVIGAFTRNSERAKVIDFSNPYITAVQMGMLVPKDSPVQGIKDLDGKTIAVSKGTTAEALFTKVAPNTSTLPFDAQTQALLALRQNQVDAVVDDANLLNYQTKLDSNYRVIIDDAVKGYIDYNGIGIRRNDQQLLNWLNVLVFQMNTDGTSKAIYKKWFGADMPAPVNPQF